jgi:hypothetical protein
MVECTWVVLPPWLTLQHMCTDVVSCVDSISDNGVDAGGVVRRIASKRTSSRVSLPYASCSCNRKWRTDVDLLDSIGNRA